MEKYKPTYITHYFRRGTEPFRSLSLLQDEEAIELMRPLADDSPFGERFKDPESYLKNRRRSEAWVRKAFVKKGGKPHLQYPIYFVLGDSSWMVRISPDRLFHQEVHIPLDAFDEEDISFTYPDSMISYWLDHDRESHYYLPELHGKVFTRSEILEIVDRKGDPEIDWECTMPSRFAPYIEAQVWVEIQTSWIESYKNVIPA